MFQISFIFSEPTEVYNVLNWSVTPFLLSPQICTPRSCVEFYSSASTRNPICVSPPGFTCNQISRVHRGAESLSVTTAILWQNAVRWEIFVYVLKLQMESLFMQLLTYGHLKIFCFLSCHYRKHHKGQRLWGDDADWLWSNGYQDPPHQVVHHPTFAQGQSHRPVLPSHTDGQPGHAPCRCADGFIVISAAPVF